MYLDDRLGDRLAGFAETRAESRYGHDDVQHEGENAMWPGRRASRIAAKGNLVAGGPGRTLLPWLAGCRFLL
jgi:hypothetical protein